MGGHDDSGSSEKKSIGVANDVPTLNAENMRNNMKAVYYCRTFMCIIGGVVAGILGFTGLTGFIFYFLVMAITSVGLIAKAGFSIHSYFDSWNQIIFDGILGGLMVRFSINFQLFISSLFLKMFPLILTLKTLISLMHKILHFLTYLLLFSNPPPPPPPS
ncbi:hypothetical protein HYC85_019211 [Camellia sinensis]|uniref:ER membrane protein complex subunit 6 n=1 Tax=Camellia sinensis TaxID=4442 RepID=A0A7J7GL71_CAMSI|nr:hypothetical protein HYC85_019211 [Camellia sinensis]